MTGQPPDCVIAEGLRAGARHIARGETAQRVVDIGDGGAGQGTSLLLALQGAERTYRIIAVLRGADAVRHRDDARVIGIVGIADIGRRIDGTQIADAEEPRFDIQASGQIVGCIRVVPSDRARLCLRRLWRRGITATSQALSGVHRKGQREREYFEST